VPLPWSDTAPPYGFSPDGAGSEPWLPQPATWGPLTAAAQDRDPHSTLNLYRQALRLRSLHWREAGDLTWLGAPEGVVAFQRGRLTCWTNAGDAPVTMPQGSVLLHSHPAAPADVLPPDSCAWLSLG
jgi:alpha-glucosidase